MEENFDYILYGTDLPLAILAGALSRSGKKVLHLDPNAFYGGSSGTLTLTGLKDFVTGESGQEDHSNNENETLQTTIANIDKNEYHILDLPRRIHEPNVAILEQKKTERNNENEEENDDDDEDKNKDKFDELKASSRMYNIDLAPKVCLCDGPLVKLLVTSGVHRYTEFKCLQGTYMMVDGQFHLVPSSKGEIFQSQVISLIEKRSLMRFMQMAVENSLDTNGSFRELMKTQNLSEKLQYFLLYAILMTDDGDDLSALDGLQKIKEYMGSLGRFGDTAFLTSFYGTSEISQAFCRLSAVYGGTYILRCHIQHLVVKNDGNTFCAAVTENGDRFNGSHLITSADLYPVTTDNHDRHRAVSRCVCVTSQSLVEGKSIILAVVPPNTYGNSKTVYIQQLDHTAQACPKEKFVWNIWTESHANDNNETTTAAAAATIDNDNDSSCQAKRDLSPTLALISSALGQPDVVEWAIFYQQGCSPNVTIDVPANVTVLPSPSKHPEISDAVAIAKQTFEALCPGDEYLPPMPEPEDPELEADIAVAENLDEELRRQKANEIGVDDVLNEMIHVAVESADTEHVADTPTDVPVFL